MHTSIQAALDRHITILMVMYIISSPKRSSSLHTHNYKLSDDDSMVESIVLCVEMITLA